MRVIALLLAVLLTLAAPARALAHASLIDSVPADGALVKEAPPSVELRFNEPVEALVLMLVDPQGNTARLDGGRAATDRLTLAVPPGLGQGTHLLSWRVVSADGHPVGGSLVFSIGQASGGDAAALETASQITATNPWSLVLARWLMLIGLAFGVGGTAYLMLGQEQRIVRRIVEAALALGIVTAAILIGLEGLEAHGLGHNAFWRPLTWRTGWRLQQALTAQMAIGAMALAAIATRLPRGSAAGWTAAAAFVIGLSGLLMSGHATTAPPQWLVPTVLAVHLVSVTAWVGALVPLAIAALTPDAGLQQLRWFSNGAVKIFLGIVVSGLTLAVVQAGSPSALATTTYGQLLLAKVGLVAGVLAIAAGNRYRLTGPALAGNAIARRRLGQAIAAEALIAIVILAIVATWRVTPPPRALAQMREPRFQIHMHGTDAMASVLIQPARTGPVRIVIEPKTPDLVPFTVKEVSFSLTGETPGMEPLRREAKASGAKWEIDGLVIPTAGRWRVRVDLLIDDFERTGLDAVIIVRQ